MSERVQDLYNEKEFEELLESARMNASEAQQTTLERIANDD